MEKCFRFGGVTLRVDCDRPFSVSEALERFSVPDTQAGIGLNVLHTKVPARRAPLPCVAEDMFRRCYTDGDRVRVEMKGSPDQLTAALYREGGELRYEIYFENGDGLTGWLSLLPIHWLLYPQGVLFLHASRVAVDGGAIVFTGPSGIGKTTQAMLWQQYAGAEILGNDRVLLRRVGEQWQTCGYFEDGDSPVCSPRELPLRAVVLPVHSAENSVCRELPSRAVSGLMSQTIGESWDRQMIQSLLEAELALVEQVPVYRLECRADAGAVDCLRQQLKGDGVIE